MSMTLRVMVPPHPLINHWLTILRNQSTPNVLYSTGLEQIGRWLTYEAIRDWIPIRKEEIETSQGKTEGSVIESQIPILAIPQLPAGLDLWQGARDVLPNAQLCLGGLPQNIETNAGLIFFIDQITTGEELLKSLSRLQKEEISINRVRIITALAASPGLKVLGESIPDLKIHCGCIDKDLTGNGEIIPGIGNPLHRINTRITGSN